MPYVALQSRSDLAVPHGLHYWEKAGNLRTLDEAAVDAFLALGSKAPSPLSVLQISLMGGAVVRVPQDATAFAHRDAAWMLTAAAAWPDDDPAPERHVRWARAVGEAMVRFSSGGVSVNAMVDDGTERVRAAYTPETYARLAAPKATYDPTNLFRLNQNITPTNQPLG